MDDKAKEIIMKEVRKLRNRGDREKYKSDQCYKKADELEKGFKNG